MTPPGLICSVANMYYPRLHDSDSCVLVRKENKAELLYRMLNHFIKKMVIIGIIISNYQKSAYKRIVR